MSTKQDIVVYMKDDENQHYTPKKILHDRVEEYSTKHNSKQPKGAMIIKKVQGHQGKSDGEATNVQLLFQQGTQNLTLN